MTRLLRLLRRVTPLFRHRLFYACLSATLALAGILTELLSGDFRAFWRDHPLAAGLIGSGITLLITLFLVDELIARREARRWRLVASTAVASLQRRMPDIRRTVLQPAWRLVERWRQRRINALALGTEQPQERLVSEVVTPAHSDDGWRTEMLVELGQLVETLRADAARWAPVMLSQPGLAEHLNRFTSLVHRLEALGVVVQAKWKHEDWEQRVIKELTAVLEDTFSFETASGRIHQQAEATVTYTFMRVTPPAIEE